MLAIKYALLTGALSMFIAAAVVLGRDARKVMLQPDSSSIRWRLFTRYVVIAILLLLPGLSIVVVPSGMAGVRVSQLSGTVGGTVYPGTHFVSPLVQHMELYSVRDQIYSTTPVDASKQGTALKVYSREGLPLGLGISVRYQLDPRRLAYMESNLPRPIESELLPAVVANAFRQTISGYMVRDVFSTRREEVRRAAADTITRRLASDGIIVKEVMLRDIDLPQEYAKGLEGLLVKVQENDRLTIEVEMKQKMVRTAELEAEADKVRDKVQIMMVPIDGKGFFANDVLKAATSGGSMSLMSPTR